MGKIQYLRQNSDFYIQRSFAKQLKNINVHGNMGHDN